MRLLAPFIPYLAEDIYKNLTNELSVHLSDWPGEGIVKTGDIQLIEEMKLLREIVQLGHAARKSLSIKVRQPLKSVTVFSKGEKISKDLEYLLLEELNVKKIIWQKKDTGVETQNIASLQFDTKITPELKAEGEARDLIREIQEERKKLGCKVNDFINLALPSWPESFTDLIKTQTLAKNIVNGDNLHIELVE